MLPRAPVIPAISSLNHSAVDHLKLLPEVVLAELPVVEVGGEADHRKDPSKPEAWANHHAPTTLTPAFPGESRQKP